MAKGYFLSAHRSYADPIKKAAYNLLARDALEKVGGKVIAMAKVGKNLLFMKMALIKVQF
ncbi:hypothetical protein N9O98_02820 [Amylibacter sp.]|nr:hypothetical protein [Amylibacter sp.]